MLFITNISLGAAIADNCWFNVIIQGAKKRKKCIKKIQKLGNGVMAKALEHEVDDEEGLKALYRKAIFSNDKTDVRILDASFQAIMNDYQEEIKKCVLLFNIF